VRELQSQKTDDDISTRKSLLAWKNVTFSQLPL